MTPEERKAYYEQNKHKWRGYNRRRKAPYLSGNGSLLPNIYLWYPPEIGYDELDY